MIDVNELRRLAQAVIGWGCCNQAWLDQSEDTPAAVVGHINEDGETYPVVTIDCDQYSAAGQSLPLGKFYAAANPAGINELLHRLEAAEADALEQARLNGMGSEREAALLAKLEAAEKERDALRARIEAMERQEPEAWCATDETGTVIEALGMNQSRRFDTALYLAPGAQPAQKAVAYLDLGVGGYMDVGTDLNDEQLASLPKGLHMLGIVGTYGVDGYVSAQPAPSFADGWKEAAISWEVCASIHREYARGKDPFFSTRQGDFVKHAQDARNMFAPGAKGEIK